MVKKHYQTCWSHSVCFRHILSGGYVSLRICAASEQKLVCEQVNRRERERESRLCIPEKLCLDNATFQQFSL